MCAGAFHRAACLVEQAKSAHDVNNAFKKIRAHAPFLICHVSRCADLLPRVAELIVRRLKSLNLILSVLTKICWDLYGKKMDIPIRSSNCLNTLVSPYSAFDGESSFFLGGLPTLLVVRSCHIMSYHVISCHTSSAAQGGGGSFKNRKPIGEVGCCESRMAERSH